MRVAIHLGCLGKDHFFFTRPAQSQYAPKRERFAQNGNPNPMDENLRILVWIAGSGGFFAVLGSAFGALAGALYSASGRSAGTGLGHRLADAVARARGQDLSITARGGIVGAVDGFLFLGVLGSLAGAVAVSTGKVKTEMVGPVLLGSLLLVGGAAFFGSLAYTITRAGIRALAVACGAAALGAFVGLFLAGTPGLLAGCITGVVLGNLGSLCWHHYAPRFVEPSLPAAGPARTACPSTDVTETPDQTDKGIQELPE